MKKNLFALLLCALLIGCTEEETPTPERPTDIITLPTEAVTLYNGQTARYSSVEDPIGDYTTTILVNDLSSSVSTELCDIMVSIEGADQQINTSREVAVDNDFTISFTPRVVNDYAFDINVCRTYDNGEVIIDSEKISLSVIEGDFNISDNVAESIGSKTNVPFVLNLDSTLADESYSMSYEFTKNRGTIRNMSQSGGGSSVAMCSRAADVLSLYPGTNDLILYVDQMGTAEVKISINTSAGVKTHTIMLDAGKPTSTFEIIEEPSDKIGEYTLWVYSPNITQKISVMADFEEHQLVGEYEKYYNMQGFCDIYIEHYSLDANGDKTENMYFYNNQYLHPKEIWNINALWGAADYEDINNYELDSKSVLKVNMQINWLSIYPSGDYTPVLTIYDEYGNKYEYKYNFSIK